MKRKFNIFKPFKQNKKIIMPFIFFVISVILISILFFGNLLPTIYFLLFVIGLSIINFIAFFVALKVKKRAKRISLYLLVGFLLILFIIGTFYFNSLVAMLKNITKNDNHEETYYVIVRNDDSDDLKKYKEEKMGIVKGDLMNSLDFLEKSEIQYKGYYEETLWVLANDLENKKISIMILKKDFYNDLRENYDDFDDIFKVIFEGKIKIERTFTSKAVDVTKDTFAVLLTGIDTEGEIETISRSDMNMLMVINPITYEVLQIHIPRDFYMEFHGLGYKDKLTHSGTIGPEMTVKTLEDFFEIDINYYVKVNMTTVVKLIDIMGGVEVNNPTPFCHGTGPNKLCFSEGKNYLTGYSALRFSRERVSLNGGDRQRGKNQQLVIEAIIKKMTQPVSLARVPSMMGVVGNAVKTNISSNEIDKLFKYQLSNMPNWTIKSMSVNGESDVIDTPLYPFPMDIVWPNMETVKAARNEIVKMIK